MKESINKTVTDLLKVKRDLFKKSVKKEIKESPELPPKEIIERIERRKEREHQSIVNFKRRIEAFYTNLGNLKIPLCEKLEARCINLEIIDPADIINLYENSTTGRCDFYNKCKYRKEDCGYNLKNWNLSLTLPDHKVYLSTGKKINGEE